MPNSGGQWARNFDRPVLNVQVIGPDEAQVRARLESVVAEISPVDRNAGSGRYARERVPDDHVGSLVGPGLLHERSAEPCGGGDRSAGVGLDSVPSCWLG